MLLVALFAFLLPLNGLAVPAVPPIPISVPSSPPTRNVVGQNFLGISFELSFMDLYFGNDTSTIPPTIINYLAALRSRVGSNPLRIRIGGNSMDSSHYVPTQTSPMTQLINGSSNSNDQPVNFGPVLWDVLDQVGSSIGGATYLVGLSLLNPMDPNIPLVAGSAQQKLGSSLDGFLLGNEPDLYTAHQERPNIANYTTALYMDEFRTASNLLRNTSAGNVLNNHNIVGPTICCSWNLDALLDDGYISNFTSILKYISLQHYPQNNCFGSHAFDIPYYVQHPNAVSLAAWEESGINKVISSTSPRVIMSEFNSASCGGVPGVSDTFAVGSLWTVDYALQMASIGYDAAYIHTRELGVTYNIFSPPDGPNGGPGAWTTNPPYYGLLVAAEALRSKNGSIVTDLNVQQSKTDLGASVSGYAIYDAGDSTVQQLVLFNYANVSSSDNSSTIFSVPANVFSSNANKNVAVKYLQAQSLQEKTNIAWGGQTFVNVGDGKPVSTNASWAPVNAELDCSKGCSISVPAPGLAVVFAGGPPQTQTSSTTSTSTNSASTNSASTNSNSSSPTKSGAKTLLPSMSFVQFFAVLCALVVYSRLL